MQTQNDPLKEWFKNLPEIEPSQNLKGRILQSIKTEAPQKELWFLKPAMAFASYLIVTLLGTFLSINYLQTKLIEEGSPAWTDFSPILRWTQTHPDINFLKPSI